MQEWARKSMGKIVDQILIVFFWVAGALLMFSTVGTCMDVILRYCFNRPIPWMLEITEYIMLYIPFLGAALVLKEDGHIRVDIFINRLGEKKRGIMDMVALLVGGIVMSAYTWFGGQVTWGLYTRGVPSLESLKTPMFLILMIIPIGGFLFAIQFFRKMYRSYQKLKSI
jgi:TRAP-type C4-dicarboxylate transport system permease small subunit